LIKNSEFSKDDIQRIYKTIGKNVKRIRVEKGISQLNLAMAIGHKSVGVISNCELCLQNKHFNIEHLVKIADVLDVDIRDFFENVLV
jgi:transcriptional regulator with XRE-family HTH domain